MAGVGEGARAPLLILHNSSYLALSTRNTLPALPRSVSAYVPNETGKAKLQVERNEYLVNKHFNGWQDEVEKNE